MPTSMVAVKGTQDARERLVAVATELFGERGYHQAGTEEIVRRSGVTRGLAVPPLRRQGGAL